MPALSRLLVIGLVLAVASCTDDDDEPAASTIPTTVDQPTPSAPLDVERLTGSWLDAEGREVPPPRHGMVLHVGPGPEHCGMQGAIFLTVTVPFGSPASTIEDWRVFVRDPDRTLTNGPPWDTLASLELDSDLPRTAQFTGFTTVDGIELWLDEDQQYAFVTDGETVERWPRVDPPPLCA